MTDKPSEFDVRMMRRALEQADRAAAEGEVPVGCVVARDGVEIAAAGNRREARPDPTAHAEMIAVVAAAARLGDRRLTGCTLYVTLEPCPMCAGAIVNARIPRVVYGADDPKAGAVRSLYQLLSDPRLNHRCIVVSGVLADECADRLSRFFAARREKTGSRE